MASGMEDAVREALELAPSSLRTLSRGACFSEKLLRLIRDGQRSATPPVVEALAETLELLAEEHAQAAAVLRHALKQGGDH